MCLCWSNWLVCIPMIINRFTFRQWWNLVKYRNTVNIWCWPEKWLRTTAAAVWKVYHLTYNSIHNMTHHSQNSVRQLELSWKLFLVYLLSIWSVSMGDFWVLRRWGFCVWGDKRRRGREEAAIIWLTCLNMSIWITIQSGWNENWSDDAYCVLRLARLSFSFLVNVYTDQAPHQWNWIYLLRIDNISWFDRFQVASSFEHWAGAMGKRPTIFKLNERRMFSANDVWAKEKCGERERHRETALRYCGPNTPKSIWFHFILS